MSPGFLRGAAGKAEVPFLGMEKTGRKRFGEINQGFSLGNVMFEMPINHLTEVLNGLGSCGAEDEKHAEE